MTDKVQKFLLIGALGLATAVFVGVATAPATAGSQVSSEPTHAKVDLNTASAAELAKLEGIDQASADAIVRYREANGPFSKMSDLLDVQGMTKQKVQALSDELTLGPAGESATKKY